MNRIRKILASLLSIVIAVSCIVMVMADPAVTYADYSVVKSSASNKWEKTTSPKMSAKYYYAWLYYEVTANTATSYSIKAKLMVHVNEPVSKSGYNGALDATGYSQVKGTADTYYNDGKGLTEKTVISERTYTYSKTAAAKTVTLTGKVWASTSNGTSNWNGTKVTASKSFTIPARKSYTVTYNANGGTGAPAAQTKWHDVNLTLSTVKPALASRVFQGWATTQARANAGTVDYRAGGNYTANAGATLWAVWGDSTKVYYNANGGSLTEPNGGGYIIAADGSISRNESPYASPVPTITGLADLDNPNFLNLEKRGYHIVSGEEWNTNEDGSGKTYDQVSPYYEADIPYSITLYANWKPNTYSLRFDPNAAGVSGAMPDQLITYDQAANVQSNSFINPGYKLVGWDLDPDADPGDAITIRGDKGAIPMSPQLSDADGDVITLYAVWRPIEESSADIYVGKTVKGSPSQDSYVFRIEPYMAWSHENESTGESGHDISAEDMPMPEGTETVPDEDDPSVIRTALFKDVEVTGLAGNADVLRTQSVGLISFEDPGYYVYRVSELIPSPKNEKVTYDRSGYFVVVYVEYKEETGYKVKVGNVTAWHNSRNSEYNKPELKDISEITDNGGSEAAANEEGVYGKTGIGLNSIVVRFWNEEDEPDPELADFYLSKNVTGSLGDITKKFEFTAVFSGLAASTTYSVLSDGATLADGFSGNSFTTDASGRATLSVRLSDGEGFGINDLPTGAVFNVTEASSNHKPSYTVTTDNSGEIKSDSGTISSIFGSDLSTGNVTMSESDMYMVTFENNRELAPNTGLADRGLPAGGLIAMILILSIIAVIRAKRRAEEDDMRH